MGFEIMHEKSFEGTYQRRVDTIPAQQVKDPEIGVGNDPDHPPYLARVFDHVHVHDLGVAECGHGVGARMKVGKAGVECALSPGKEGRGQFLELHPVGVIR
jgi:hypothetical protein